MKTVYEGFADGRREVGGPFDGRFGTGPNRMKERGCQEHEEKNKAPAREIPETENGDATFDHIEIPGE
jgi:hypothetical protein